MMPSPISSPAEQVSIEVNPQQGGVNSLLTVTGVGWWPGEPVFVFLRSPQEGNGRGYSYAAAVVDERGNFHTTFTFPNEVRWIGQAWADVIARGNRSGQEAVVRFMLLPPTPTDTPAPPTAHPTLAATNTPLPSPTPWPSLTPLPSPTPEALITAWRGEYHAGVSLGGAPILVRNDAAVDFNWGAGSPGEGLPEDRFSARWVRQMHFDAGLYRFTVLADDGVRFWIDGQLVLNEWHESTQEAYQFDLFLSGGTHALQVEYYENLGGARVSLRWALYEPPTPTIAAPTWTPAPTIPPDEPPTPEPEQTAELPFQGWLGEYYDNLFLGGAPLLTRVDLDLDFDWGSGSPGNGVPADDFSARWTRRVSWPAGVYRFRLEADDGARLWIDGALLIDAWPAIPGQRYMVEVYLPEGEHHLIVEYYEVTLDARLRLWSEVVP